MKEGREREQKKILQPSKVYTRATKSERIRALIESNRQVVSITKDNQNK